MKLTGKTVKNNVFTYTVDLTFTEVITVKLALADRADILRGISDPGHKLDYLRDETASLKSVFDKI